MWQLETLMPHSSKCENVQIEQTDSGGTKYQGQGLMTSSCSENLDEPDWL